MVFVHGSLLHPWIVQNPVVVGVPRQVRLAGILGQVPRHPYDRSEDYRVFTTRPQFLETVHVTLDVVQVLLVVEAPQVGGWTALRIGRIDGRSEMGCVRGRTVFFIGD